MDGRRQLAIALQAGFAARTGLADPARPPRRYLWTDAFATCNLLALDRATGERRYLEQALALVAQVHRTLGRHRPDDARRGWLSGLPEAEAEAHPTCAGLRIGKPLPERAPGEPIDEDLEWERDGQYFHYLTRWMHALDRAAAAASQPLLAAWARELAVAAHHGFIYAPRGGGRRMAWKMSIDLSRPLVASMGQHDPLDGYVACRELEASARALGAPADRELLAARADLAAMLDPARLATADPLGLGGLLADASRLDRVSRAGAGGGDAARVDADAALLDADAALVDAMLDAALAGLGRYADGAGPRGPAARRLAFRELGLAIGLAALEPMRQRAPRPEVERRLDRLARFAPLGAEIEAFWREPAHRAVESWRAHEDINAVMLATCLLPGAATD